MVLERRLFKKKHNVMPYALMCSLKQKKNMNMF